MASERAPDLQLRLFGVASLSRDSRAVEGLTDLQLKTLALLVLNGSCMYRDALIGHLWPDAQLDSGRHQLRNVLSRLRSAGLTLGRQGEAVVLRDRVWCDVETFILRTARVLTGLDGRAESFRLGISAQELWSGPPLEAWRYEAWAIPVRARAFHLQRRLWELLDRISFDADWPPTPERGDEPGGGAHPVAGPVH